jgi:hypothetical protein
VTRLGRAIVRRTRRSSCTEGFRASVRGSRIKAVVFTLDGRRIASRRGSPYTVLMAARPGAHKVRARITFTDATRAKTVSFDYKACAAAVRRPRVGPSQFTG